MGGGHSGGIPPNARYVLRSPRSSVTQTVKVGAGLEGLVVYAVHLLYSVSFMVECRVAECCVEVQ